jgi:hypothetical protein
MQTRIASLVNIRSWYDQNGTLKDGFDFNEPPMIFECNDLCECNVASCNNRVVQHGITARIQVPEEQLLIVVDPHHVDPDLDPTFHLDADLDRDPSLKKKDSDP